MTLWCFLLMSLRGLWIKTCHSFQIEKFFTKWLADMAADQRENGQIGHIIPDWQQADHASAAWGDAAVICPWEIYMAYGNVEGILAVHFGLSDDCRKTVDQLANMIEDEGGKLQTGFVGTPYLLHVLSNCTKAGWPP